MLCQLGSKTMCENGGDDCERRKIECTDCISLCICTCEFEQVLRFPLQAALSRYKTQCEWNALSRRGMYVVQNNTVLYVINTRQVSVHESSQTYVGKNENDLREHFVTPTSPQEGYLPIRTWRSRNNSNHRPHRNPRPPPHLPHYDHHRTPIITQSTVAAATRRRFTHQQMMHIKMQMSRSAMQKLCTQTRTTTQSQDPTLPWPRH